MNSMDIVIVRDGDSYRLLHGHLRLANMSRNAEQVRVQVPGEGEVAVVRQQSRYFIIGSAGRQPLRTQ